MDEPHHVASDSSIPRARAVLAADRDGSVHLIAAHSGLLDLVAFNRQTARELRVIAPESGAVSAVPGFYPHKVVVDEALFAHEHLELDTECRDEVVGVSRQELEGLTRDAMRMPLTRAVGAEPTAAPRTNDLAAIHTSLKKFTELRIRQRLDQTLTVPPLPEAARRIIALKADPDYAVRDITRIVEADPSLAARILGWANSAYYGLRNRVTSLTDAVARVLGPEATLNMALAIATRETLRVPPADVRGLSPYWLTAVFSAATMEALARILPARNRPNGGLAYLAGLLSNFGTLVVGHVFPPYYAVMCKQQEANLHLPHTHIDAATLGVSREAFAAELLQSWSVPDEVCDAVRFQHVTDYSGPHAAYVGLLRLTTALLNARGLTSMPHASGATETLSKRFELDADAVNDVMTQIASSADELHGFAKAIAC